LFIYFCCLWVQTCECGYWLPVPIAGTHAIGSQQAVHNVFLTQQSSEFVSKQVASSSNHVQGGECWCLQLIPLLFKQTISSTFHNIHFFRAMSAHDFNSYRSLLPWLYRMEEEDKSDEEHDDEMALYVAMMQLSSPDDVRTTRMDVCLALTFLFFTIACVPSS
jgi:hypothetical protein